MDVAGQCWAARAIDRHNNLRLSNPIIWFWSKIIIIIAILDYNNTIIKHVSKKVITFSLLQKKKKETVQFHVLSAFQPTVSQAASSSVFLPGHGHVGGTPPDLLVLHCWWQHGSLLPHLVQLQPYEQPATDDPAAIYTSKKRYYEIQVTWSMGEKYGILYIIIHKALEAFECQLEGANVEYIIEIWMVFIKQPITFGHSNCFKW